MENAQATISTHGNAANWVAGSLGASSGLYNAFNANYSFNPSPDIIAKAVYQPRFDITKSMVFTAASVTGPSRASRILPTRLAARV